MTPNRSDPRKIRRRKYVFDGLVIDPRDLEFREELDLLRKKQEDQPKPRSPAEVSRSGNPDSLPSLPSRPRKTEKTPISGYEEKQEEKGFWTPRRKTGAGLAIAGSVIAAAALAWSKKEKASNGSKLRMSPKKKPWWKFW
jgi:hypothetical protein